MHGFCLFNKSAEVLRLDLFRLWQTGTPIRKQDSLLIINYYLIYFIILIKIKLKKIYFKLNFNSHEGIHSFWEKVNNKFKIKNDEILKKKIIKNWMKFKGLDICE